MHSNCTHMCPDCTNKWTHAYSNLNWTHVLNTVLINGTPVYPNCTHMYSNCTRMYPKCSSYLVSYQADVLKLYSFRTQTVARGSHRAGRARTCTELELTLTSPPHLWQGASGSSWLCCGRPWVWWSRVAVHSGRVGVCVRESVCAGQHAGICSVRVIFPCFPV